MPRGDKTGPNGSGAMSGRRMGFCTGNSVPGFQNNDTQFQRGGGFGFRRRFGNGYHPRTEGLGFRYAKGIFPSEPVNKKAILGEQIENLKLQLNDLENQFKKLD